MRISTTALMKSALLLVAVLALVPQFAFAQLPVETRELKLQGATSGAVTLATTGTTTSYTMTFPGALGGPGSFLFIKEVGGGMAFTNTPNGTLTVPRWNNSSGNIEWVDPNGADNPNWSLSGNALAAGTTGTLGTTTDAGLAIKTATVTRMSITSAGVIELNTTGSGASTTIGRSTGHTTNVEGTANINAASTAVTTIGSSGATNINTSGAGAVNIGTGAESGTVTIGRTSGTLTTIGSLGHTGAATVTGTTNINNTGTAATSIGTASGAGATTIGRSGGTTTIIGDATINNDVDNTISINGGTSTGAVTIGGTGTQTISIGNGAGVKTVNLGSANTTSTTTILSGSGAVNINASNNQPTNINTGTSTGAINVGNTGTTVTVLGPTNINTSGSKLTSIGNSGSGAHTNFSGEIQMEGAAGSNGNVLVSKGTGNTPAWQNLNDAIGIRKAGIVTGLSGVLETTVTSVTGLASGDAIIVTLENNSSAVVATVSARNTGASEFTVKFSAAYSGSMNYMVIRGQ